MFRLKGKGVPALAAAGAATSTSAIFVETPTHLSKEQRELLERFAELSGEETHPRARTFWEKVAGPRAGEVMPGRTFPPGRFRSRSRPMRAVPPRRRRPPPPDALRVPEARGRERPGARQPSPRRATLARGASSTQVRARGRAPSPPPSARRAARGVRGAFRGVPVAAEALHDAATLRRDGAGVRRAPSRTSRRSSPSTRSTRARWRRSTCSRSSTSTWGRQRDGLARSGRSTRSSPPRRARRRPRARPTPPSRVGADADAVRWLVRARPRLAARRARGRAAARRGRGGPARLPRRRAAPRGAAGGLVRCRSRSR